MSSASQSMINIESLFGDHDITIPSHLGIFPLQYTNLTSLLLECNNQPLRALSTITPPLAANLPPTFFDDQYQSISTKQEEGFSSHVAKSQFPSLQTSATNNRAWRDDHLAISTPKIKKIKGRRKVRDPRFCFKTMSDVDILDDGYKWRKYGQKIVKNTLHPRSYYRCTQDNCRVKKRVERLAEDPRMVITTYEGRHFHSPSQLEEDSQAFSQFHNFFI